jgi:hypothetical protein
MPAACGRPTLVAPVTQLADASICARRYRLLYELGLDEHPAPGATPSRAAELGTLAHRLLELAPLDLQPGERKAALLRLLDLESGDSGDPAHAEVLAAVLAYLDDPLAARMARASGPPRVKDPRWWSGDNSTPCSWTAIRRPSSTTSYPAGATPRATASNWTPTR